ncbi:hypothetical protein M434DRAFT_398873 [Hypoxylon sp. CO27-5]|nr:hypothetical protein M434DRAFT_398873 [Hypoxylon sp. CO27-5]
MSLKAIVPLATVPDTDRMRETADLQLDSIFFGKLPLEIRDIIYAECWKASGLKQHILIQGGSLTHWPCTLASQGPDERLEELRRIVQVQEVPLRSHTRALRLDDKWSARFSSPWHEHWGCEEDMRKNAFINVGTYQGRPSHPRRTLFLPILLSCKRMYLEARRSLYSSITLTFTDLAAAHAYLALSRDTVASQLRSLAFSLVLPFDTLHQHRLRSSPAEPAGSWAELCTALSNLVRFAALRDVTIRLGIASTFAGYTNSIDENKTGSIHELFRHDIDVNAWWQVRERWVLSAVRGMLARHLVLQLPRTEPTQRRPTWALPYSYPEYEDGVGSEGVPFRRLERYAALPPMRFRDDGRIEPRMDAPRCAAAPLFPITSNISPRKSWGRLGCAAARAWAKRRSRERMLGARRGVRELVAGFAPNSNR